MNWNILNKKTRKIINYQIEKEESYMCMEESCKDLCCVMLKKVKSYFYYFTI